MEIILAFDNDKAGNEASARVIKKIQDFEKKIDDEYFFSEKSLFDFLLQKLTISVDKYKILYFSESRDLFVEFDRQKQTFKYFTPDAMYAREARFSDLLKFGEEPLAYRQKQERLKKEAQQKELRNFIHNRSPQKFQQMNKILWQKKLQKVRQLTFAEVFPEDFKNRNICCPFHDDSRPSFKFYEKAFHCFGCGEHGDVIKWWQHKHNCSFRQAVLDLEKYI